jgi:FkbM family methyltransferase
MKIREAAERLLKPHYLFRPRQVLRRLVRARRPRGETGGSPQLVELMLPWGLPLRVSPGEDIGRAVDQLGLYDLTVSETLWRLTDPGDLAVDVGANLGHMTGLLALRTGPSGRVLAFEPHPAVFADLEANMTLVRKDPRTAPVELTRTALSDAVGSASLDPGDDFAAHRGRSRLVGETAFSSARIPVLTTTLDLALGERRAAVVKIDVEESEAKVLRGAHEALRDGRILHLVYEAFEGDRRELAALLQTYGYTVFVLGRTFFGLHLGAAGATPRLPAWEPPSCLATRAPDQARARLRSLGWQVLSRGAAR